MNRRIRRWLSMALLVTLALTQASVAFAACTMERGQLAEVLAVADAEHDCCPKDGGDAALMTANTCVALSTADLQVASEPAALFLAVAGRPVLLLPQNVAPSVRLPSRLVLRDHVPPRILLHSFLI